MAIRSNCKERPELLGVRESQLTVALGRRRCRSAILVRKAKQADLNSENFYKRRAALLGEFKVRLIPGRKMKSFIRTFEVSEAFEKKRSANKTLWRNDKLLDK